MRPLDRYEEEEQRESDINVIRKVAPYLWPKDNFGVKVRVVSALLALVFAKVISVITPLFYQQAVDILAGSKMGEDPSFLFITGAVSLTIAYGFMRAMTIGFNQLRDVIFAFVGQRALRKLALETFQHIHALSLRYHLARKTGGLSRIIERGVKGVEFLLRFLLFSVGPLIIELLLICVILAFKFDTWYALVLVITIVVYVWFTFSVTAYRVRIRKQMIESDTEATQKAIDSLLNYETVKYFSAENREADRYDASMASYQKAALKTAYSLGFLNFGQAIIITIGLVIVMVMAAMGVQSGELTVGEFVLINSYMILITMPLNFLGSVYREIRQALVDMGEMFELLDRPQEVKDAPSAPDLNVTGGEIEFKDVEFSYEPERQILNKLSFTAKPGQKIAIVGPSGSGKSTIGRLLFRFYDVNGGGIEIDGQDLRDVTQSSVHHMIGIVPQDTVLFNDNIGYNVLYGRPDATKDEMIAATKAAKIHEFILSLPDGYQTAVGERGLKLSGGEKQRVGIARTLLKNPPILLLDEATSALDTETERDIQESLNDMGKGRTVITIAHRLSTVVDADLIIVLEKGVVVETGTHDELLQLGKRYNRMWMRQLSKED